jgi:hypothetical protein
MSAWPGRLAKAKVARSSDVLPSEKQTGSVLVHRDKEGLEVERRYADRVQHPNVPQLALIAKLVHGRGANAESMSDLANRKQSARLIRW